MTARSLLRALAADWKNSDTHSEVSVPSCLRLYLECNWPRLLLRRCVSELLEGWRIRKQFNRKPNLLSYYLLLLFLTEVCVCACVCVSNRLCQSSGLFTSPHITSLMLHLTLIGLNTSYLFVIHTWSLFLWHA